jgi:uncharacterized protein YdeI (BOF family)
MKTMMLAAIAMTMGTPVLAQTSRETSVKHDTQVKDGVATATTRTTTVAKRKTAQPKKILGVKVGTRTAETKTVRERSVSSNGDMKTKVKTSH